MALAGGWSAEKAVDDEVTALFGTPEVSSLNISHPQIF
jgi:hypothetical protein